MTEARTCGMRLHIIQPASGAWRYGPLILREVLRADGHSAELVDLAHVPGGQLSLPLSGPGRPDAWLISVLGHRDWLALPPLVESIRAIGGQVVIGGQAADLMEPWALHYADVLAIGDIHGEGRHQLYAMLRRGTQGICDMGYAPEPPPPLVRRGRGVIFAALGCRRRCPYCRIGSAGRSAAVDRDRLLAQVRALQTRIVNIYSPSGDHPAVIEAIRTAVARGQSIANTDYHPGVVSRMIDIIPPGCHLHTGVEGMSERIRRTIGRPLTREMLHVWHRRRRIWSYYMAGLPGETDDDAAELYEDLWAHGPGHHTTITPMLPIPGSTWAGLDGHLRPEVSARMARARETGREIARVTGRTAFVAQPKGADLHEAEVALLRAGERTPRLLAAIGRRYQGWRRRADAAGIDVEALLSKTK